MSAVGTAPELGDDVQKKKSILSYVSWNGVSSKPFLVQTSTFSRESIHLLFQRKNDDRAYARDTSLCNFGLIISSNQ